MKNRAAIFVTGNAGKLRELQAVAAIQAPDWNFQAEKIDIDEIQSLDLREILEHKLRQAYAAVGQPVICEDVSAGLASLNGLPGPFIKFFEKQLGLDALYKLSKVNHDAVTIVCTAGYYDGQRMIFGEGVLRGHIVAPRGSNGFGFDSVVVPDGQPDGGQRTAAEMTPQEKNAISHRALALRNLLDQL